MGWNDVAYWLIQVVKLVIAVAVILAVGYPITKLVDGGGRSYPGGSHTQRDR